MLSLYFITTTGYSLTHRLGSFFCYITNIVWAYYYHSRKAETKGCLFFLLHISFLLHLLRPVTTQLLKECTSSRIGLPTYTPVQQSTFLRLLRLLLYSCYTVPAVFQRRFPWLCSVPSGVFCVTRLLTLLAIDSVRLIRAKFFGTEHCLRWKVRVCFFVGRTHTDAHTRGLSSLTRKKEMPFRMWPVGVFWCLKCG